MSTLRDRVCITAAMLVLEPIFEADLPPEQYAYRPGRNAQQAVVEVEALLFRDRPEVVDADLADYFGSIPHAELLKSVARRIVDRPRAASDQDVAGKPGGRNRRSRKEDTYDGGAGQPARHPARLTDLTPAGESVYAPVRAGMEDARAGAKPRLSHRDVPWVKAGSLVREPDAGNVHVRFDERDVKTEPRSNH
jgi:hypothetical protein